MLQLQLSFPGMHLCRQDAACIGHLEWWVCQGHSDLCTTPMRHGVLVHVLQLEALHVQAKMGQCWTACGGPQPPSELDLAAQTLGRAVEIHGKAADPLRPGPDGHTALRLRCMSVPCAAQALPGPGPPDKAAPCQLASRAARGDMGTCQAPVQCTLMLAKEG